jgi:guanosine-3',5'-bis(diphosphate) 3'-pyrophosphohydrolase
MRAEGKTFDQVMDVFGFRIVVRSVPECYHALGVAHSVFKPLDGRFRDFIAIPKANGYQSLHTGCSDHMDRRSRCRSAPRKWT